MRDERGVDELASRCVALIIFHQHAGKTRPRSHPIHAEFRAVAAESRASGISPAAVARRALADLHDRFEPEVARRLHLDYLAGFTDEIPTNLIPA